MAANYYFEFGKNLRCGYHSSLCNFVGFDGIHFDVSDNTLLGAVQKLSFKGGIGGMIKRQNYIFKLIIF